MKKSYSIKTRQYYTDSSTGKRRSNGVNIYNISADSRIEAEQKAKAKAYESGYRAFKDLVIEIVP